MEIFGYTINLEKKNKSMAEVNREVKKRYGVMNQKAKDLKVGDHIKVIVDCQDFHFFNGETGIIIDVQDRYLGIKVKFDKPRPYKCGWVLYDFNFNPDDLYLLRKDKNSFRKSQDFLRNMRKKFFKHPKLYKNSPLPQGIVRAFEI